MTTPDKDETLPDGSEDAFTWRPLRVFASYRLIVATSMALAVLIASGWNVAPDFALPPLLHTALAYLSAAALCFALARRRWPHFAWQLHGQLALDIIALTLIIHFSGAIGSGLGVLLLIAVAGGSLLSGTRMALFYAALASLALILQQTYHHLTADGGVDGYSQAGLLGIGIFCTALVGNWAAQRARESQALADRRGLDLANLQALNHHVVQRLPDGVLALDEHNRIRLSNYAAWRLLGSHSPTARPRIDDIAPALAVAIKEWRAGNSRAEREFTNSGHIYRPRFQALGPHRKRLLVFLQDVGALRAQVQREKLASLGRLTAGIAHEIRNPLSAMLHAAQLLAEDEDRDSGSQRLVEIIQRHGARLNEIVDSVLQLSRRQTAKTKPVPLKNWLATFCDDFRLQHPDRAFDISTHVVPASLAPRFDAGHLRQVLDNLCGNALQHGGAESRLRIRITARRRHDGQPELLVYDSGRGLEPDTARRLFEPFYTTSRTGTGLGLYLCRELCEANEAQLEHVPSEVGSCFRIRFADANKEVA